jgi:short-subunit dehydrogenase
MTYQRNILITGATDGLGLALAHYYRGQGERPLLLGRKPWADLPHLAETFAPSDYCQADLASPDAAGQTLAFLTAQGINRLDLIIHNAGVGSYGHFATQSAAAIDEILAVNVYAPMTLTQALLPWLPAGRGQVVFIGSVVADLPGADYAVYTASKAALAGLVRSLRAEWRDQVTVQLIQPGAARTGMHAKMGLSPEQMDWRKFPPAEKVAKQIAGAIAGKRPFTTIGPANQLASFAGRHLPFALDPLMGRVKPPIQPAKPTNQPTLQPTNQPSNQPPTCLITGAAGGIGKALAYRFAQAGYTIIGLDVAAEAALEGVAELGELGGEPTFILVDLSTAEGVETAVSQLLTGPPIDVLIHCAGISAVGPFGRLSLARQRQVLDLNLRAPLQLTAALAGNGRFPAHVSLVFLASLSNFVGYPGAAVYAASKMGLAAYARSLRAALGRRAYVLTVYPGPTRTAHARRYSPDNGREAGRMPPEVVAEGIFQAVQKRRQSDFIPGAANRAFALIGRLLPGLMDKAMWRLLYAPLRGRTLE